MGVLHNFALYTLSWTSSLACDRLNVQSVIRDLCILYHLHVFLAYFAYSVIDTSFLSPSL